MLSRSSMLIVSSEERSVPVPCLVLPGLLLSLFVRLVRMCRLVSVSFLAPPSLLGRL